MNDVAGEFQEKPSWKSLYEAALCETGTLRENSQIEFYG
jgi:hypothetical protein